MNDLLSIIVVSSQGISYLKQCLDILRHHVRYPIEHEIIVVDNESTDGTLEYLQSIEGVMWEHRSFSGLSAAFNHGIRRASGTILLLLHDDVVLSRDAIVKMYRQLCECSFAAAIGPLTNRSANVRQVINVGEYDTLEDVLRISDYMATESHKVSCEMWLDDFCLMVWREVLDECGGFDERFRPHGMEDMDLSLRVLKAGYRLLAANSVFVHHEEGSPKRHCFKEEAYARNHQKFVDKWHFRPEYSLAIRDELIEWMDFCLDCMSVLELGCACGGSLMRLQELCPKADLYGIEMDDAAADIAACFGTIYCGDVESMSMPEWKNKFDYVLCGDVIEHLQSPEHVLQKLGEYLKPYGTIILSVPNVMHISIFDHLLHGEWPYSDMGILDRTHMKFFTRKEIIELMEKNGFQIEAIESSEIRLTEKLEMLAQTIGNLLDESVAREELKAFQWHVKASKIGNTQRGEGQEF